MHDYVLCCESTADYPPSFFEDRQIPLLWYRYDLDGTPGVDDLYRSTTPEEFFDALKNGAQSRTSQPSTGEYVDLWEPYLKRGLDVLHVTLSSGVSGAYNGACMAAELMAERYPERTVRVVDSLAASSGFGMLVEQMADRRDAGMGLEELARWAEDARLAVNHWFFVSDLDCLKRGGRVSSASAVIATALKICPVLDVDVEGRLVPCKKIRTAKKAIAELARVFSERAELTPGQVGPCVISHSQCREDAEELARLVAELAPELAGSISIHDIGTVIGSHTGPGTVALFFMGKRRDA